VIKIKRNKEISLNDKYSTTRFLYRVAVNKEIKTRKLNESNKVLFSCCEKEKQEGGLRLDGYYKKNTTNKPLITVVTVVYNGESHIEKTIKSVINQTYENVEYIIIDGGSNDRTLNIIKKYERLIDYWISEKDGGIYDAMNKSLKFIDESMVNFLNAGDIFYNDGVLSNISKEVLGKNKIIYGDVAINNKKFKSASANKIDYKMICCHQSLFIASTLLKKYKFNTCYEIVADYDFMLGLAFIGLDFFYVDRTIATMPIGGASSNVRRSLRERREVHKKYFGAPYAWVKYLTSRLKCSCWNIVSLFRRRIV